MSVDYQEEAKGLAEWFLREQTSLDPMPVRELALLLVGVRDGALDAAIAECEGERKACERHHLAMPKRLNHKVGMQIASVCAHRIERLKVGREAALPRGSKEP